MMYKCKMQDCIYRMSESRIEGCDFYSMTGKLRSLLPGGKIKNGKCGFYCNDKEKETCKRWDNNEFFEIQPYKRKTKYDWDHVRKLYDQGLNDHDISRTIGCAPQTVTAWRHYNNLPSNWRRTE